MPKYILYTLLTLILFPSVASAKVNVEISNNLDDSRNSVNIKSNTGSNQESSNSVNSQTDIVINNNGEKKEYHGTGDGVIELKSEDGKSTVTVNNNSVTNNPSPSSSSKVTTKTNITVNSNTDNADSSPSANPSPAVAGISIDNTEKSEEKPGLWASFKKQFSALFKLFS